MSSTMERQGGRVQLEQSDVRLAMKMAKMAKGGFSRAGIKYTQFLIKQPRAEVQEEKERGVESLGHQNVEAAMERHPDMLRENQTDSCLPCQNGIAKNPQTRWRDKGTGSPLPEGLRQPTPEPTPHPPDTPLVSPCNHEAAHLSEIKGAPPWYVYVHTPPPSGLCFNQDAYAKDHRSDKDFDPDLHIHWLVHYLPRGNAADIHFGDDSSQLREPCSEDEHWLNEKRFLSILWSTISGHFKVYFKRYIYMYYSRTMFWWRRKYMKMVQRLPKHHWWSINPE